MVIQPQWIAKMYKEGGGRDHLGLGSVSSDQILPKLSPGVNVLTIHPRYHSFYVFLLDEFWSRERVRTRASWTQFYRPREFIFSIGAHMCDRPEHGAMGTIVGAQKTEPLAARDLPAYQTSTNYIKSPLGGYGLYYRSVMADLDVVYPGGPQLPTPIDIPTERGKQIAESFRRAVRNTTYYKEYFEHDDIEVPRKVIVDYIRKACLCQLQVDSAPDHEQLLEIFLHAPPATDAAARRATLCMFLDIADQAKGQEIYQGAFRQLVYFGATSDGASYKPRPGNAEIHRRWRLYQAREYYAFALNALWSYICWWGVDLGGEDRPVSLEDLWSHVPQALAFKKLCRRLDLAAPDLTGSSSVKDLLTWIDSLAGRGRGQFDDRCKVTSPVTEHLLYELALAHRRAPEVMVAGMITLLSLVYLRFGDPELRLRPEWEIARAGAEGRLSLDGFMREFRRRAQGGESVSDVTRWLLTEYVIAQHQVVASSKLPDNTFRFWREGSRLRFYDFRNPLDFNDSRFVALSTTVHELGLSGSLATPKRSLTTAGRKLLSRGDLDAGA